MTTYRVNYRLHRPGQEPKRAHVDLKAFDEDHAMAEWMCNKAIIRAEAAAQGCEVKFSGLLRRVN